ncbi:MAG: T9SS type A sorting domain-containing protein, partial [Bacteroidota bacterium]
IDYSWSNGAMGDMVMGLPGGMITVTATDANGCTDDFSVDVPQPAPVGISFDNITGNTGDGSLSFPFSGSISASVSGGTSPIEFMWDGPGDNDTSGTDFLRELCSGDYILTATDANGCVSVDTATIEALGPFAEACASDSDTTVSINPAAIGIDRMQVFPNPSTGVFAVELRMQAAYVTDIEVFNFAGQRIAIKHNDAVSFLVEEFDLSSEASGIYMLKVTTPLGTTTEKVVLR